MNCLVHNPYIWLKYCFLSMARAVKLKNTSCPSLPLPNIQWREGIYKHSSSKRAKDMCMPLAIEATNLLQVKSSWANEVPWIGSKVGRFSYCFLGSCCHLCFFMRSSTCLPWEIFFSTVSCQNFGGPMTSCRACVISYHQDKGLRLLLGMLIIQQ